MADKYYIYEIVGVKIGCTQDMERRQYEQRDKGKMVVLESHINIEDATRRERELQLEKGYTTDEKSYKYVTTVMQNAITQEGIDRRNKNRDMDKQKEKCRDSHRGKMIRVRAIRVSDNKVIGTYNSLMECSKALGIHNAGISNVLNPKCADKTSHGYTFERVE